MASLPCVQVYNTLAALPASALSEKIKPENRSKPINWHTGKIADKA